MSDGLQQLWRDQPLTAPTVDLEALRGRAERFRKGIQRRNVVETIAAVFVATFMPYLAFDAGEEMPLLSRVGLALAAPGALFVIVYLWRRGAAGAHPDPSLSVSEHQAALRVALGRQAELMDRAWLWYVGPLLPVLVLFNAGLVVDLLRRPAAPVAGLILGLVIATQLGFLVFIVRANRIGARRLRSEMTLLE